MQYKQLQEGLERLNGTLIQTNIKTNGKEITKEFGLIESWEVIKEDGKLTSIEVTLSDWFYNSILGDAVLTIDKDYFRLRKPTERRLYELARKHCGSQTVWKIKLGNLKDKLGVTSQMKLFRFNIKKITETNHLPNTIFRWKMTLSRSPAKSRRRRSILQNSCRSTSRNPK